MTNNINFVKMHGLGNDCIIINRDKLPNNCDLGQLAKQVCNRHIGIGADQFIIYSKNIDYYDMTIYNQDGSPAKACGNASRCLIKLINFDSDDSKIVLKVGDRIISGKVEDDNEISVNMGKVSFTESWMPKPEEIWAIAERYGFELKEVICADVANPHLVIFSNVTDLDRGVIGEKLQESALFPGGVNVNFASISDNTIYLKVWERGAGFTFACGSGAIVSFAAAKKLGFVESKADVVFELGKLKMKEENSDIIMTGPAILIAQGVYSV
jgi:diaminopimelate epimerase